MRSFCLTAAAVALCASLAGAEVVVNGGFELPINAANGWTTNTGFTQSPLGSAIPAHSGSFYTGATSSSNATRTNTLAQVLPLNAGDVVDFQMWYKLASNSALASITVTLDGNLIYSATPGAVNILTWTSIAMPSVTINNANPSLTITQTISGRSNTFLFDDVSVNVIPAPAAGAVGIMALGLIARRRR